MDTMLKILPSATCNWRRLGSRIFVFSQVPREEIMMNHGFRKRVDGIEKRCAVEAAPGRILIRGVSSCLNMLLKLPLSLFAAWCTYITVTPPSQPPTTEERLKPKGLELIGPHYLPKLFKCLWIPPHLIEAVAIVACNGDDDIFSPGASIRYSTFRYLGEMFTAELALKKNSRLVTSGPYSVVRHPSYSGVLLASIGIPLSILCHGSWLAECSGYAHSWLATGVIWAPAFAIYMFVLNGRIKREDAMLSKGFGNEWVEWSKAVPWKLLRA
ncbi:hypothetical protein BD779DRAFT_1560467, partial [Infundibulicybe gibba]